MQIISSLKGRLRKAGRTVIVTSAYAHCPHSEGRTS
jgi:hypothetical protein